MDFEFCDHGNELQTSFLTDLHHSQAGTGRHRCATCAYYFGYHLGCSGKYNDYDCFLSLYNDHEKEQCKNENSSVPTIYLNLLQENQGGSGRHKCCNCAFVAGFKAGLYLKKQVTAVSNANNFKLKEQSKPVFKKTNSSSPGSFEDIPSVVKDFDYIAQSNYLQVIGEIGEEIVLNYLKQQPYIITLGKKIVHVSKELGDGLGYDILAYDAKGEQIFIEVKTTVKDKNSPFFISSNEYNFLHNNSNAFIYRVYNLNVDKKTADFFILDQQKILQLDYKPSIYKVYF